MNQSCIYPRVNWQMGFSTWLSAKESACQCRRRKKHRFNPWVGKIPWSRKWQPTPVFLLENPMDRGAWRNTVHGVSKESDANYNLATKHKHGLSPEPMFYFSVNLLLRQCSSWICVMIFHKSVSVSSPTRPCRNGVVISALVYTETEMES